MVTVRSRIANVYHRTVCASLDRSHYGLTVDLGITFRHEQNPSVKGGRSLKNFFGYREQYTKEQEASFLPTEPIAEKCKTALSLLYDNAD